MERGTDDGAIIFRLFLRPILNGSQETMNRAFIFADMLKATSTLVYFIRVMKMNSM